MKLRFFANRKTHVTMGTMGRRTFQAFACLLFGFVPLTVVVHVTGAAGLPSSLVSHFNSDGTPAAWITKSGLLELYLGCMLLVALAGSAIAYLSPKEWVPDLTAWLGLFALFGVTGLMVYSESEVLAQQNSPFSDPVVDALVLSSAAMALAWRLCRWTQPSDD